jgi:hypothetical protein
MAPNLGVVHISPSSKEVVAEDKNESFSDAGKCLGIRNFRHLHYL